MLNDKLSSKFEKMALNYLNGNKKDAAKIVRGLTRIEIVKFFNSSHQNQFIADNFYFSTDKIKSRLDFEEFIESALDGYYM